LIEGCDVLNQSFDYFFVSGVFWQMCSMNGGSHGNGLIWVDLVDELVIWEVLLEDLLHLWNSSRASDKDDVTYLLLGYLCIFHGFVANRNNLHEIIEADLLEFSTGDDDVAIFSISESINDDFSVIGG